MKDSETNDGKCPVCGGTGEIYYDCQEKAMLCPDCKGSGYFKRLPIQIAVLPKPFIVLALCNDGTMWANPEGNKGWRRISDIPHGKAFPTHPRTP